MNRLWISVMLDVLASKMVDGGQVEYRVEPTSYMYLVFEGTSLDTATELFGYHWRPNGPRERVHTPHFHLSSGAIAPPYRKAPWQLDRMHFTTGPITLAMFVRMLIDEFDVEPLVLRWEEILSPPH